MFYDKKYLQCSISGILFRVGDTVTLFSSLKGNETITTATVNRTFNTIYLTDEDNVEVKRANITLKKTVALGLLSIVDCTDISSSSCYYTTIQVM